MDARAQRILAVMGVVVYAGGVIDMVGGTMLLVLTTTGGVVEPMIPGGSGAAIVAILGGVIAVLLAGRLVQAEPLVRLAITIVRTVSLLIATILIVSGGPAIVPAAISAAVSAVVLLGLWAPRVGELFSRLRVP